MKPDNEKAVAHMRGVYKRVMEEGKQMSGRPIQLALQGNYIDSKLLDSTMRC